MHCYIWFLSLFSFLGRKKKWNRPHEEASEVDFHVIVMLFGGPNTLLETTGDERLIT